MSLLQFRNQPSRPDRPGPGPLPDQLLRALDVQISRRIDGLAAGDFRSTVLGEGTELAQVRPYVAGDDIRRMDWNVTARTGAPHVRVHVAERALTTWALLDCSASMVFGTQDRRKLDVAEGVALATSHLGTRGGNRFGLMTFGGHKDEIWPATSRRGGVVGLLSRVRMAEAAPRGGTSMAEGLHRAALTLRTRGVVVVISDWRDSEGWRKPLAMVGQRHHVIAVEIRDRREMELVDVGDTYFVDLETGRQLRVDTADAAVRRNFANAAYEERKHVRHEIIAAGAEHVVLHTSGDWLRPFAAFMSRREQYR
ncbi:MAG: DUF58 domain-containing protein [Actinomycetota bacterium]